MKSVHEGEYCCGGFRRTLNERDVAAARNDLVLRSRYTVSDYFAKASLI